MFSVVTRLMRLTSMSNFSVYVTILLILDPCSSCSSGSNKNQANNKDEEKLLPNSNPVANVTIKPFPNVGYALKGYNILDGNPFGHDTDGDPGFTKPIFRAEYTGKTNADWSYSLPDGVSGQRKEICQLKSESKEFSNEKKYQEDLSQRVGLNLDLGTALSGLPAFSANRDYKEQTKNMKTSNKFVVVTENECTVYVVDLDTNKPPKFEKGFLIAAKTLEKVSDKDAYLEFVEDYGTHYLTKAHMGARYAVRKEFSKQTRDEFYQEGMNINAAAKVNFMVTFGVESESNDSMEIAKKFQESNGKESIVAYGSKIPKNGDATEWANSIKDGPLPIKYELKDISDLFTKSFMGNTDLKYKKIFQGLKDFLKTYCSKKQGAACNGTNGGCEGGNDCHQHATCTDTQKGYTCSCNEGYDMAPDGKTCRNWKQYHLPNDRYTEDEDIPGTWRNTETCPKYHYAYKFSLKLQNYQGGGIYDDSALNGVRLYCKDQRGKSVTSGVGGEGSWTSEKKGCANDNFFVGYRFISKHKARVNDEWYGEFIDIKCEGNDNEDLIGEDFSLPSGSEMGTHWASKGDASSWVNCEEGYVVCGLQTKIMAKQASLRDDSGLTDIKLICCSKS